MGVLMESSQVNIHARAEQGHQYHHHHFDLPHHHHRLGLPYQGKADEDGFSQDQITTTAASGGATSPLDYCFRVPPVVVVVESPTSRAEDERRDERAKANRVRPRSPSCDAEEPSRAAAASSMPPPKKKWMKNYMEEEPLSCAPMTTTMTVAPAPPPRNGIRIGPPPPSEPIAVPVVSSHAVVHQHHPSPVLSALPSLLSDSGCDIPRARSNSNGSSGPRAGTREVHNKLEKNRRAHLKECFEALRLQLPSAADDKKSSNLSILDSANKCIQALKRREKEFEHEMERLAREKISKQQKLAELQRLLKTNDRDISMEVDETISSRISPLVLNTNITTSSLPIEMMCTSRTSPLSRLSPTASSASNLTLDLTTKSSRSNHSSPPQVINLHSSNGGSVLYPNMSTPSPHSMPVAQRSQSAQIIGTFSHNIPNGGIVTSPKSLNLANPSQNTIRAQKLGAASSSLPTLTVTTVNQGQSMMKHHHVAQPKALNNGQTTIVHPAQIQLQPFSQVMNGGSLVVSPTIQLISTNHQGLRVLPIDIPGSATNNSIQRLREVQKVGDVGISVVNGTVRASSEHNIRSNHHQIAIKPQPSTNIAASIRPANSQGIHMVNGITPVVVSGGTHIMTSGKVMSGTLMKSGMNQHIPLAVNTQYLSAAAIVKPAVVVVSTSNGLPPPSSS